MNSNISTWRLLGTGFAILAVSISLALVIVWFLPRLFQLNPGDLSLFLGSIISISSVLAFLAKAYSVIPHRDGGAHSELLIVRLTTAMVAFGLLLILLGILYLMGLLPDLRATTP